MIYSTCNLPLAFGKSKRVELRMQLVAPFAFCQMTQSKLSCGWTLNTQQSSFVNFFFRRRKDETFLSSLWIYPAAGNIPPQTVNIREKKHSGWSQVTSTP